MKASYKSACHPDRSRISHSEQFCHPERSEGPLFPPPLFTFVTIFALLILFALPARADIVKIRVDDTVQPITAEYITRAINHAKDIHASALLIELSTPGGLESSMREIVAQILSSPVPVIIYVAPSGSRAASAGFFILESADVAAMAPGTNTGAAHPVTMSGGDIPGAMGKKVENDAAAFIRSYVARRGRNVELAESAVRESKSWSDEEALKDHLIDVVAKNQDDLFQQLQGRTITRFNGEKVQLNLVGQPVQPFDMTVKQHVLDFMMNPNMAFIIFAIGMLALYVEFNHPGAVVPGVVGLIFIVLAVFAFNILPVRFAAVGLILLAFVLFALDAKLATHGALTVGGIACMVVGALLLVDSPVPEMRVKWITALSVSIPFGFITAFLVGIAVRARRNKVATGPQALIGEIGVARTPLVPEGKVVIHGEIWDAISSAVVNEGDQAVVLSVEGLKLRVEPAASHPFTEQRLGSKSS
jgi:membrane-bound serine protease (ClpP class)